MLLHNLVVVLYGIDTTLLLRPQEILEIVDKCKIELF